ncbi:HYC_CC_PP family protein [Flavobacterium silvaticum]|uniref:Uncharacterized protein n=1 Tax=Flavobacterium silvaticum TaxID=1852020 RepID=A0A972FZB7_9FLAO|nr:hypothetical protein [Flavobacterium silvaticum]NMH27561.1 hypothetical protein [Flavobacterium silvaticum]
MLAKKCIGIWLTVLLLASQSGFAFHVHYCGGEVASVKPIFNTSDTKGCCGKMDKAPSGCCKDKIVKADKGHDSIVKTFSVSFEAIVFPSEIPSVNYKKPIVHSRPELPLSSGFHANGPPLYCLYSQYTFYA